MFAKNELQIIIDYFKEVWDINFYMFHEGKKKIAFLYVVELKKV